MTYSWRVSDTFWRWVEVFHWRPRTGNRPYAICWFLSSLIEYFPRGPLIQINTLIHIRVVGRDQISVVLTVFEHHFQNETFFYTFTAGGEHNVFAVLAAPNNMRCRMSGSVARKRQVFPFAHHQIRVIIFRHNLGRNYHFKVSGSMSHGISVDLAHVPAPVIRRHPL